MWMRYSRISSCPGYSLVLMNTVSRGKCRTHSAPARFQALKSLRTRKGSAQKKGSIGDSRHPKFELLKMLSQHIEVGTYTSASWVSLIIPRPSYLVSLLHNDEVPALSLPYHLNGGCHSRQSRSYDQHVRRICIPSIFQLRHGIGSRHFERSFLVLMGSFCIPFILWAT